LERQCNKMQHSRWQPSACEDVNLTADSEPESALLHDPQMAVHDYAFAT
jgi:hypothetical protein